MRRKYALAAVLSGAAILAIAWLLGGGGGFSSVSRTSGTSANGRPTLPGAGTPATGSEDGVEAKRTEAPKAGNSGDSRVSAAIPGPEPESGVSVPSKTTLGAPSSAGGARLAVTRAENRSLHGARVRSLESGTDTTSPAGSFGALVFVLDDAGHPVAGATLAVSVRGEGSETTSPAQGGERVTGADGRCRYVFDRPTECGVALGAAPQEYLEGSLDPATGLVMFRPQVQVSLTADQPWVEVTLSVQRACRARLVLSPEVPERDAINLFLSRRTPQGVLRRVHARWDFGERGLVVSGLPPGDMEVVAIRRGVGQGSARFRASPEVVADVAVRIESGKTTLRAGPVPQGPTGRPWLFDLCRDHPAGYAIEPDAPNAGGNDLVQFRGLHPGRWILAIPERESRCAGLWGFGRILELVEGSNAVELTSPPDPTTFGSRVTVRTPEWRPRDVAGEGWLLAWLPMGSGEPGWVPLYSGTRDEELAVPPDAARALAWYSGPTQDSRGRSAYIVEAVPATQGLEILLPPVD